MKYETEIYDDHYSFIRGITQRIERGWAVYLFVQDQQSKVRVITYFKEK